MRFTSPSRRALGLLAASTIGMSTAVLGVAGVAAAAPDLGPSCTATVPTPEPEATPEDPTVDPAPESPVDPVEEPTADPVEDEPTAEEPTEEAPPSEEPTQEEPSTSEPVSDVPPAEGDGDIIVEGAELAAADECPAAPTGGEFLFDGYGTEVTVAGATSTDLEYSLDGGETWEYVDGYVVGDAVSFYLSTGEAPQSVHVRNIDGGENSAATQLDEVDQIGAPTITSVVTSPSGISVTWTAPTEDGTYDLAGYEAGYGQGEQGDQVCDNDTTVLTCTMVLPAGDGYVVSVFAVDEAGYLSQPATTAPLAVPVSAVPSTVPTKDDGDIVGPAGPITSVTAGQKLTLQGSGFLPFSTVQLSVFSAPVSLGTVVTDENGAFSVEVTLPATLTNGTHTLVATGIAPDGSTRNLVITVTVSGGVVTNAALAQTGFETSVPLAGGALAVLAGAGLLVGARRRSTV